MHPPCLPPLVPFGVYNFAHCHFVWQGTSGLFRSHKIGITRALLKGAFSDTCAWSLLEDTDNTDFRTMGMSASWLWPVYPASWGGGRVLFCIRNLKIWILGYLWLKPPRLKPVWGHDVLVVSGQTAVLEHCPYPLCWSWSLQKSMQPESPLKKKKFLGARSDCHYILHKHSLMQKTSVVPSIFCRGRC